MSHRGIRLTALALGMGVLCLAPGGVAAQAGRGQVEDGNRLYEEGRFQEAYERYLEALREAPGSPLIQFNQGGALYQGQEFERAMDAWRAALEGDDPELAAAAWYNVGNALFRAQQLEESLEAYKQALRLRPGDADAKHNLERVLEMLQQQQDQQENEDQQQNEDQQNDGDQEQQDQQQQDQQDEGQDPDQEQDQQQGQPPPGQDEQPPQQEEGQPPPGEGDMTREEAERLLQAIQEDPGEVDRKQAQPVRGRILRKKW